MVFNTNMEQHKHHTQHTMETEKYPGVAGVECEGSLPVKKRCKSTGGPIRRHPHKRDGINAWDIHHGACNVLRVVVLWMAIISLVAYSSYVVISYIVEWNVERYKQEAKKQVGVKYLQLQHCTNYEMRYEFERHNLMDCVKAKTYSEINPEQEALHIVWQRTPVAGFFRFIDKNIANVTWYSNAIVIMFIAFVGLTVYGSLMKMLDHVLFQQQQRQ